MGMYKRVHIDMSFFANKFRIGMADHELVITANFPAYISTAPLRTNAEHSS